MGLSGLTDALAAKVGITRKALLCIKRDDGAPASNIASAMNAITAKELWASNKEFISKYKSEYFIFEVQYNPETIGLSCNSGEIEYKMGPGDEGVNNINSKNYVSNIYFDVDLIFEKIVAGDSYKTPWSATDMLKTAIDVFGESKYSVQSQVEGLLALLTRNSSRMIVLHWDKMTFVGKLNNINATYSMFSSSGRPVKAKIHLKLIDRAKEPESGKSEAAEYWDDAFNSLFGSADKSSLVEINRNTDSMSGIVSNMLGL
ncbi:MAG: hypothetical protein II193_05650 [Lachnospiraceae bacterium]|nr:hypothetical protein [Lachnospiraceae bacterium]